MKKRIREGLEKFIVQGIELGSGKKKEALLNRADYQNNAMTVVHQEEIKAYNKMRKPKAADAGPSEVDLLTEIRDSLRARG